MEKMNPYRTTGLLLMLLLLVAGPFFQGYFFPQPMLTAQALTGFAFGLWLYGRRQDRLATRLDGGLAGLLLLALAGLYLLAFGWAAYARGNLDWLLRTLTAFLAFVMIREESRDSTRRWLGWTIIASAVIVAVFGLLEYTGFFNQMPHLARFFRIDLHVGRLYSLFQYPNTAGAFLVVALLILNVLLLEEAGHKRRMGLGAASSLIALALIFTLSRGVIVVLPVAVLLLLIGLPRPQMFPAICYMVAGIGLPILIGVQPVAQAATTQNWPMGLLWSLVAVAAGAVATLGTSRLLRLPRRTLWLSFGGLLAALSLAAMSHLVLRPTPLPSPVKRLLDIDPSTINAQARFVYVQDAIAAVKDQPWGYGGAGWERAYPRYQQVHYIARETHNHYAQVLVEGGVPGLLLLVAALVTALWTAFRHRADDPLRWAMAAAGGSLAAHAAIDFDLSYFMIWLLLWVLLAAGQPPQEPLPLSKERRYLRPAALAASLLIALTAADLAVAAYSFNAAEAAALKGDMKAAVRAANRAIALDPINSRHLQLVASVANLQRATELDPYNPQVWRALAEKHARDGNFQAAIAAGRRALAVQPMSPDRYSDLAEIHAALLEVAIEKKDQDLARHNAGEILALADQLAQRKAGAGELLRFFPAYTMDPTPPFSLAIGKALFVTGDLAGAESRLKAALKAEQEKVKESAALWLHALYTRTGNEKAREALPVKPPSRALQGSLYKALLAWR